MILCVYDIVLWLALPFVVSYHFFRSVTRGRPAALAARFGFIARDGLAVVDGKGPIWVHAVSVGETIAVKPLLKALKERFPERRVIVSNGTETGRGVSLTIPHVDRCIYFPFDYGFAVKRLLSLIQPSVVLIVETEIWPNFLHTAREMGIPTAMVNGRISDRSVGRYLRMRWFFSRVLSDFSWFCMQTGEDARRIIEIGAPPDRVEVTRNLKYDLPVASVTAEEKTKLRATFRIPADIPVFTAGSTHQGEDEVVVSAYKGLIAAGNRLLMILAPRHPERIPQVADILRREGLPFTLKSKLFARAETFRSGEILLVDTIGDLMKAYAVSDVVFVGGSFVPTGGHNILEPASLRVPVLFGPHMSNFREAAQLVTDYGGGCQVEDEEALARVIASLLQGEERRRVMGESGGRLMEDNSGSTLLHLRVVERLLEGR